MTLDFGRPFLVASLQFGRRIGAFYLTVAPSHVAKMCLYIQKLYKDQHSACALLDCCNPQCQRSQRLVERCASCRTLLQTLSCVQGVADWGAPHASYVLIEPFAISSARKVARLDAPHVGASLQKSVHAIPTFCGAAQKPVFCSHRQEILLGSYCGRFLAKQIFAPPFQRESPQGARALNAYCHTPLQCASEAVSHSLGCQAGSQLLLQANDTLGQAGKCVPQPHLLVSLAARSSLAICCSEI